MIIQPTRRLSIPDDTDPFTQPGVVSLSDGTHLFGYTHGAEPGEMIWLRSIDEGTSWTARGSGRGTGNSDYCFAAHAKENVAVYPQYDFFFDRAHLITSTDGGATWTITGTFESAESLSWECWTTTICSIRNGGRLIAGGQFAASQSQPQELLAISDNSGASWTTSNALTGDTDGTACGALAAAGGDRVFAIVNRWDGVHYKAELHRSDDGGATWTDLGQLPLPGGANRSYVGAATCPTKNQVCISGQIGGTSVAGVAGVWYSHDSGSTVNIVSGSNIANFPTSVSYAPAAYEVKRLTRDSVIITFDTGNGASTPFFALSLDGGATYDVAPSTPIGGWLPWTLATGAIVATPTGKILIPAFRWPASSESYHELWQCTLTC